MSRLCKDCVHCIPHGGRYELAKCSASKSAHENRVDPDSTWGTHFCSTERMFSPIISGAFGLFRCGPYGWRFKAKSPLKKAEGV